MISELPPEFPTTASEEARWDAVRGRFMNDPEEVYLNTGSWGVLPRSVYETMAASIRERELNPTRSRASLLEGIREARNRLGGFIHASPSGLALLMNVTVAINLVVSGPPWQPGDEILASDQEYGAIDNCLHNASKRWGVTLRRAKIPIPPTCLEDFIRAFEAGITDRTRLLLCGHITTGTGLIAPVKALAELAHAHGALIVIDGAHAPGMVQLDLEAYGCDFYGGNCQRTAGGGLPARRAPRAGANETPCGWVGLQPGWDDRGRHWPAADQGGALHVGHRTTGNVQHARAGRHGRGGAVPGGDRP
jgi:isopenicillin-N epimerase